MGVFAGDSKTAKVGLLCAASVGAVAAVATGALAASRIKTLCSLKKLSSFAGAYNLYESTVAYRYDLDAIIKLGVEDDQTYIDAVCKQVFPGIPVKVEAPKFACSTFCAEAPSSVLMGRNYDFKDDTSALLVRTHPKDGYASISFSALNNLGANMPEESLKSKVAAMLGPFASLDGINEKGVSIAVLTLDSLPTRQNSGKPKINTSLAIRLVLDRAASTQEAVDLLGSYDRLPWLAATTISSSTMLLETAALLSTTRKILRALWSLRMRVKLPTITRAMPTRFCRIRRTVL